MSRDRVGDNASVGHGHGGGGHHNGGGGHGGGKLRYKHEDSEFSEDGGERPRGGANKGGGEGRHNSKGGTQPAPPQRGGGGPDGDGDDGGSDAVSGGGVLIGGRRGAAPGLTAGKGGRLCVNGKELLPSHTNMTKFMVPFALWELTLVVIFAVSFVRLQGMQASHVIYRYTRVRMAALLLVSSVGEPPDAMAARRALLTAELDNLHSEYDTLMYGGLAKTQAGSVFTHPVPASTFESASFASNFFREERCFRWDQSQCYTPDSPYYEVTHHGLDVMMRRILAEMSLLAEDADADVAYNGTRYTTMYMVGTKDLYEGLQSSAQLFVDFSIDRYSQIKLLHTVLLVITIVFFVLYGIFLLRPYGGAVEREAGRLAGLLSHVPAEMDVAGHVRQTRGARYP
ncbi:hypothetical protein GPECTOR_45g148 [Gonium pectorale]|uniref:Uncharacterized protein n=1 Tax=Gonium pectorale TaxID=33097 RepID=A0A150G8X5_GONPE|nr:hypothetical protein GPECTOR_45g148 [Gonium pectorale]|eukprot:KXZ46278.1 hypothetical protein GPECTOR_45g148 [Gonium pectorale]